MKTNTSFEEHEKIRELHEEEERMKLKMLQADAGLIAAKDLLVTAERMDWMYLNPAQMKKDDEEFLFSKPMSRSKEERIQMRKRLGMGTTEAGTLFLASVTSQNEDTLRKIREDPLFTIKQAENQQKCQALARKKLIESMKPEVEIHKNYKKSSSSIYDKDDHLTSYNERRSESPYNIKSFNSSKNLTDKKNLKKNELNSKYKDSYKNHNNEYQSFKNNKSNYSRETLKYESNNYYEKKNIYKNETKKYRNINYSESQHNQSRFNSKKKKVCEESEKNKFSSNKNINYFERKKNYRSSLDRNSNDEIEKNKILYSPSRTCVKTKNRAISPSLSLERDSDSQIELKELSLKGPVLPREWREELERKAKIIKSNSHDKRNLSNVSKEQETSSDSDLAPPSSMAESIQKLRKEKSNMPLIWKTKNSKLSPSFETGSKDIIKESDKEIIIEQMMQEGKKHEEEKDAKLKYIAEIEKIREVKDALSREKSDQDNLNFLKQSHQTAYTDGEKKKNLLEERLKRYRHRRQKMEI